MVDEIILYYNARSKKKKKFSGSSAGRWWSNRDQIPEDRNPEFDAYLWNDAIDISYGAPFSGPVIPVAWEGKVTDYIEMSSAVARFLTPGASNHNGHP